MTVVNLLGPIRIFSGINVEKNAHNVAPVGPIRSGIQNLQIEFEMVAVIVGQLRARRRAVKIGIGYHGFAMIIHMSLSILANLPNTGTP